MSQSSVLSPQEQQQFTFTVGNITIDGVTLVDKEYNIIQLPKSMLPFGSGSGSIISLKIRRNFEVEKREEEKISRLLGRLEIGQCVGDNIISVDEQRSGDQSNGKVQNAKEKEGKQVENKVGVKLQKPFISPVKEQYKLQSGMKKKPKAQQLIEQKASSKPQIQQKASSVQPQVKRQSSTGRRTSSAMKKVIPQSSSQQSS